MTLLSVGVMLVIFGLWIWRSDSKIMNECIDDAYAVVPSPGFPLAEVAIAVGLMLSIIAITRLVF